MLTPTLAVFQLYRGIKQNNVTLRCQLEY